MMMNEANVFEVVFTSEGGRLGSNKGQRKNLALKNEEGVLFVLVVTQLPVFTSSWLAAYVYR